MNNLNLFLPINLKKTEKKKTKRKKTKRKKTEKKKKTERKKPRERKPRERKQRERNLINKTKAMPRTTQRKRIIQYLVAKTVSTNSFEESSNDKDIGLINEETPEELLAFIYAKRYLNPRISVPKSHDWSANILPKYDDI